MMRTFVLSFCFFAMSLSAQIADGSQAPPWAAVDIYGQEHVLYDYLSQGKTVFIEVSATWAPPNFSYHTSGILQGFYDDYGPGGTDEVMVFMYESDESTTVADIYGSGSNTVGNWTNVPFPIINDQQILSSYQIAYYPTVFAICPDGIITEVGQVGVAELYQHVQTCPVLGPLNAAITDYNGSSEACPLQPYYPSIEIQNLNGYDQDLTEVLVVTYIDDILHETQLWTGVLSQGESTVVEIAPYQSTSSDFEVEVSIDYDPDEDDSDDMILETVTIADAAVSPAFSLEIQLDQFPEETKWEFRNGNGDLVLQGGPFAGQAYDQIQEYVSLPYPGCFEFKMIDAGGDGLNASSSGDFEDGYFTLTDQDGAVVLSGGGAMQWGETGIAKTIFVDVASGIDGSEYRSFSIFPNPVSQKLNLRFNSDAPLTSLRIRDLSGRLLFSQEDVLHDGTHTFSIDGMTQGLYLLEFEQSGELYSRLFSSVGS